MNYRRDGQDIVGKEQNGFHYQTRLGITSRKIEKIYEQWSKELAKHDYGGVKSGKDEKFSVKSEWKSSRKENICVNSNEQEIMSKKTFRPGGFSGKYSVEDKKLPPFRTGKYIPKDDVYSCGVFVQNDRPVALSSKSKEGSDKVVSGSPPPFRTGKYTPNDNTIYVKSPEKLSTQGTSPSQGSPTHRTRRASCDRIMSKCDGYFSSGRKSPGSSRNRTRTKSPSNEGGKTSSLEQISHTLGSDSQAKLRSRSQISQSAEIVGKNIKSRPRSSAMENYVNSRARTRSENMLSVKTAQRPKSSILENSTHRFKAIVRDIDVGSAETSKPATRTQNRPRSAAMENPLSNRLPMKIVTNTKGQASLGKNLVVLDRSPSRESNRYLRKGSDSSERGHQRSKTTTSITSSCSERTYNAVKPRKPRRVLHRNAAYVKPRKNRNYKPVERKQGSSRKKSARASKQEKLSPETVDGCIPEKPSASQRTFVFSLFTDKFCMRTKRGNGQFGIPTIKRYRVMVWKIKRISYLLYEKVLIVYYFTSLSVACSRFNLFRNNVEQGLAKSDFLMIAYQMGFEQHISPLEHLQIFHLILNYYCKVLAFFLVCFCCVKFFFSFCLS